MSESFEIGVTLALSDGVSAGIERARREVAQLQDVLNRGGLPVERLRAASVGPAAPRKTTADLVKDIEPPAIASSSSEGKSVAAAPARETLQPSVSSFAQASRPILESFGQTKVGISAGSQAPYAGGDITGSADAPVFKAQKNGPLSPAPTAIDIRLPEQVTRQAFTANLLSQTEQASVPGAAPSPRVDRAAHYVGPEPSVPDVLPISPLWLPSVTANGARKPADPSPSGWSVAGASYPQSAPVIAAAPPPGATQGTSVAETSTAAPTLVSGLRDSVAPVTSSEPVPGRERDLGEHIKGDVYLDGMLVGRWMSLFLRREAGRAPAGPTRFDLRRDRILPGPTVGT